MWYFKTFENFSQSSQVSHHDRSCFQEPFQEKKSNLETINHLRIIPLIFFFIREEYKV